MHVWWKLHFGSQSETAPRKGGSIGLFDSQTKVRGFDIVCDFVAQRWKELANDIASGQSFAVLRFEELLSNSALGINEKIPGPRHAPELVSRLGVQDLIGPNSFGIRVGEQGKLDPATVGEVLQYFHAVIADCR